MSAFRAPWWARSAHLQTVWAPLVRRLAPPPRVRERFALPDGDFLALDWTDDDHAQPLVVVLHGLAGSGDSAYVVGIQHALRARGFGSVVMHFRGAGGEPNLRACGYHSGETGDLDALMQALVARFPARALGLVGYSLGGNVTLKWLGERGAAAPVLAACAVSTPFELAPCATRLDQGFSRIYRNRLRDELLRNLAIKERFLAARGDDAEAARIRALGDLSGVHSFWQFDDRVIAPLHGFRDAADYYARSSARQYLRKIATPTLVIHALDDPFMTADIVPGISDVAGCVQLEASPHGGHVGFVHGTPWRPRYWLEERIPAWFTSKFTGNSASSAATMISSGPGAPTAR